MWHGAYSMWAGPRFASWAPGKTDLPQANHCHSRPAGFNTGGEWAPRVAEAHHKPACCFCQPAACTCVPTCSGLQMMRSCMQDVPCRVHQKVCAERHQRLGPHSRQHGVAWRLNWLPSMRRHLHQNGPAMRILWAVLSNTALLRCNAVLPTRHHLLRQGVLCCGAQVLRQPLCNNLRCGHPAAGRRSNDAHYNLDCRCQRNRWARVLQGLGELLCTTCCKALANAWKAGYSPVRLVRLGPPDMPLHLVPTNLPSCPHVCTCWLACPLL